MIIDDEDDSDGDDDLILCSGLDTITEYRFPPAIKHCPILTCRLLFGVRSDAINHFRKKHSSDTICCVVCKEPILVVEFEFHFQQEHPNNDISLNFTKKSVSPVDKSFGKPNVCVNSRIYFRKLVQFFVTKCVVLLFFHSF